MTEIIAVVLLIIDKNNKKLLMGSMDEIVYIVFSRKTS